MSNEFPEDGTITTSILSLGLQHPERVFELDLSSSYVGRQNGGRLPAPVAAMVNLRRLNLNGCALTAVPEIQNFAKLEFLTIPNNNLQSADFSFLKHLPDLRHLAMHYCKLERVPIEVFTLRKLQSLVLGGNSIGDLSPDIGSLKSLEKLTLQGNQLKIVPLTIGELSKLNELHLGENLLRELPENLGMLKNLVRLELSGNKLKTFPCSQLPKLKELNLSSNELEEITEEIGEITSLENLDLSFNKLKYLPPSIGLLRRMCVLKLDNNNLSTLPVELIKLKKICQDCLSIERNPIISLPPEFRSFKRKSKQIKMFLK